MFSTCLLFIQVSILSSSSDRMARAHILISPLCLLSLESELLLMSDHTLETTYLRGGHWLLIDSESHYSFDVISHYCSLL